MLVLNPYPQTPFPRERLCMLGWLCIVQSLWAYTPGVRAGAECGAAALTKQGRLQSVAHSRCTTQRHQRLTTRIGATPKARMLWLLAKSFARCKTSRASNTRHPIFNIYKRFFDSLYPRLHKQPGVLLYPSVFLIPKNNLKKPASILGVLQTTIFIICTSLSAKEHQPYSQCNEQQ